MSLMPESINWCVIDMGKPSGRKSFRQARRWRFQPKMVAEVSSRACAAETRHGGRLKLVMCLAYISASLLADGVPPPSDCCDRRIIVGQLSTDNFSVRWLYAYLFREHVPSQGNSRNSICYLHLSMNGPGISIAQFGWQGDTQWKQSRQMLLSNPLPNQGWIGPSSHSG